MYDNAKILERARGLANNPTDVTRNQLAALVYLIAGSHHESLRFYECQTWDALVRTLDQIINNATTQEICVSEHASVAGDNVGRHVLTSWDICI
jgi:hypothetical protein